MSSFEREKWREDLRFREEELKHKRSELEQEYALRKQELLLKQDENKRARWNNPLTIAIVAAALAGFSNAAVTFVNGYGQNSLQDDKQKDDFQLERSKAETARILEMIKTGDRDAAANNLEFLLQTGLIQDENVVEKLAAYLENRPPGGGTVLPVPASGTNFDFVSSSALADMQNELSAELEKYVQHLRKLEYQVIKGRARIKIELMDSPNAYYFPDTGEITVDIRALGEPDSILHAFTSAALLLGNKPDDECSLCTELMYSLSDYNVASYLRDPETATILAALLNAKENYLRDLRMDVDWIADATSSPMATRDAWGALFWDMRDELGAELGDKVIAQSWSSLEWPADQQVMPATFVKALLAATRALASPEQLQHIEALLRQRKFPMDS